MNEQRDFSLCFPHGGRKALVMSYDDGSEHDRRLLAVFNEYGIRGTFNLNSARLGTAHHVSKGEVRSLYGGHEVAAHGVHHLDLTTLSTEAIDREVADDRKALEDLAGAPVRGFVYPFGHYDERVMARLSAAGLIYGRTTETSEQFALPQRPLALVTSCHHSRAMELGAQFLEQAARELMLFFVWGHSFEFDGFLSADPHKDWGYLDALCRMLHGKPDVYYTTTLDVLDYLAATRAVLSERNGGRVRNAAHRSVWASHAGKICELEPGAVLELADA